MFLEFIFSGCPESSLEPALRAAAILFSITELFDSLLDLDLLGFLATIRACLSPLFMMTSCCNL